MLGVDTKRWQQRKGQSLLMFTFFIGAIIIAIGAIFIASSLSLSASVYASRASAVAESLALAGIEDGMVQLTRNGVSSSTYVLTLSSGTANVGITQNSPSAGFVRVLSVGVAGATTRRLQAIFSESTGTYQINLLSLQALP